MSRGASANFLAQQSNELYQAQQNNELHQVQQQNLQQQQNVYLGVDPSEVTQFAMQAQNAVLTAQQEADDVKARAANLPQPANLPQQRRMQLLPQKCKL